MKSENNNNELTALAKLSKPVSDVLSLDLNKNYAQAVEILTGLVKSKKLGKVNTTEGAMAYYIKTKELGLPFISGIEHMFDIGDKTSIDVHLMRAMVLRAGVIRWEEIYNFAPLYKYKDSTGTVVGTGVNTDNIPDIYELPKGNNTQELKEDVDRIKSIGKFPMFKSVDIIKIDTNSFFNYATKYKFTRQITMPDKTVHEIVEYGEFSLYEAIIAKLPYRKDGSVNWDSPWFTFTRNMLEHRGWTFGARKIADDILFGLLERTEALDMEKIPYTIEDGKVVVVE